MLWSKRRSSRPDVYQQPTSRRSSLSTTPSISSLSNRLPFVPLDPLDPQASRFSLAAVSAADDSLSQAMNIDRQDPKYTISRQIVNIHELQDDAKRKQSPSSSSTRRDQSRRSSIPSISALPPPPPPSYQTSRQPTTDLYTINSLSSFSFGSVRPSPPPSRSINPLSLSQDEADDLTSSPSDVTPRPSVIGPLVTSATTSASSAQNSSATSRSHPTQPRGEPPLRRPPNSAALTGAQTVYGPTNHGTASHHTLGTGSSSASASATSLSSDARTGSRASRHTDSTMQTSANDNNTDDSAEEDHHHPIPSHISGSPLPTARPTVPQPPIAEFSSDEYEDSDYDVDDDYYDDDGQLDIEISSARYEGSIPSSTRDFDRSFYGYGSGSSGSFRGVNGERRGSLPMAIPGALEALAGSSGDFGGRDRGDSLATLRRPSRSLDDELRILNTAGPGGSQNLANRPLPPAPVSVPETDGDWRSLRERSKAKGKARERDDATGPLGSAAATSNSAMEGFDLDWSQMQRGIVVIDPREIAGIVRPPTTSAAAAAPPKPPAETVVNQRRPSARWLSLLGMGSDTRRPSTATVASLATGDSFGRAVGKWGGDGYRAQRRDWTFRREKADRGGGVDGGEVDPLSTIGSSILSGSGTAPLATMRGGSISGFLSPRESMMSELSEETFSQGDHTGVGPVSAIDRTKEMERERERERKAKIAAASWKGMPPNAQEVWKNDLVGRFKVDRPATRHSEKGKPPQQRISINHFRDPYSQDKSPMNGPPIKIHKHSKAIAFSISRHYRWRSQFRPQPMRESNAGGTSSSRDLHRSPGSTEAGRDQRHPHPSNTPGVPTNRAAPVMQRTSSMILLAPRKVQEAYTSTNTTRQLQSHGLLDEEDVPTTSGNERRRERERERERRKKASEKVKKKHHGGSPSSSTGSVGQTQVGSAGSVSFASTSALGGLRSASTSPPQAHTYPPTASSSRDRQFIAEPNTPRVSRVPHHRSRRDAYDDIDDDDDSDAPPPTRTPHSETYGTMDASHIEQWIDRAHASDFDGNGGFLKRFIRRGGYASPGASPQLETNYAPPWLVLASRNKQEQQQRVVDNLNTSFKDVGLLPSNHKEKTRSSSSQKHRKSGRSHHLPTVDIFEEVPADALYMLLPLWPGDTDPTSHRRNGYRFQKPFIPAEKRQYLLVYYKPTPDPAKPEHQHSTRSKGETESGHKKRSRGSPTTSHDSTTKSHGDRSILLSSFHVSARLVSYKDLQGSGVRVPDEGLTVTGPLEEAFRTMPMAVREEGMMDFVIGVCHTRETGMEFYPDGLVKMGLCLVTPPHPGSVGEDGELPEPNVELTPVGRAVVEMAWLGCMALTSFGPGV